jgi:ribosome-binding protein aMBF1 (putative translation factor)
LWGFGNVLQVFRLNYKIVENFFLIAEIIKKKEVNLTNHDKSYINNMKEMNSELGQYLRNLRKDKSLTLHQVSKGADIDSPLLSKLERGERLPTDEQIKKIAKFYKVTESDLKVKATAERIIREFGVNNTTYDAVSLVMDQITPYIKK